MIEGMRNGDPLAIGDLHSHMVPGVDDGARTIEETLEGVERMTLVGIRKIITTPHLDASLTRDPAAYEKRIDQLDRAWMDARREVRERFPEVDFRRGTELMLDIPDPDFSDERLRMGGTSFVLLEWPRLQLPPGTVEVLSRMSLAGIKPIIAHPERYVGFDRELDLASEWRKAGAFLQVNYGSLLNRYGPEARTLAFRLLRRGWVDYLSSDFHCRTHLKLFHKEAVQRLAELGGAEQISLLTVTNPQRVFRDEEPVPMPPLPGERTLWARLRELLKLEED